MDTNTGGPNTMPDHGVGFRLNAHHADVQADVRLRQVGDRWISVADSAGRQVTGIGSTARSAILASLDWLGQTAVRELLADLRLLDVSVQLADVSAG